MTTQTFWLSFADPFRNEGEQLLGCAVVDVTEAEYEAAIPFANEQRASHGLPPPDDEVYWLTAAIRKAHQTGCNPGGQVASARIDSHPEFATIGARYPRNVLLSRAEVEALEPPEGEPT